MRIKKRITTIEKLRTRREYRKTLARLRAEHEKQKQQEKRRIAELQSGREAENEGQ